VPTAIECIRMMSAACASGTPCREDGKLCHHRQWLRHRFQRQPEMYEIIFVGAAKTVPKGMSIPFESFGYALLKTHPVTHFAH